MAKSNKVHGITIELSAETSGVTEAFSDINKSLKSTTSELNTVDRLLMKDSDNMVLLAQKQKLLGDAIENTTAKLSQLALAKLKNESSGEIDKESKQYRDLEKDIEVTKRQLEQLTEAQYENANAIEHSKKKAEEMKSAFQKMIEADSVFKDATAEVVGNLIVDAFHAMQDAVRNVTNELKAWANEFREMEVYEKQFENNIRNTANATDDEIKALKQLASAKERQGVVSKKAIMSGYQELATYVSSTEAVEGLTNALLDMSAQQYGVDATEESVRNIATTLGKALANGDYSGLTKLGYGFTQAQQRIMKYGDELERVKVLNDVISDSIGGMNEALAQTDAGKMFSLAQSFGDMKDYVGQFISDVQVRFLEGMAPRIEEFIENVITWIDEHREEILEWVDSLVEWLTSEEMDNFFQNLTDSIGDLAKIIQNIVDIIGQLGLLEGALWAVHTVLTFILDVTSSIVSNINYIKENGLGSWASGNYNSYDWGGGDSFTPGWSGGFGALRSGGFASGGINVSANFTINNGNSITRETVQDWGYQLADAINFALGEQI